MNVFQVHGLSLRIRLKIFHTMVTHGGVMSAIQCLEHGILYSNKTNPYPVSYAEMVAIEI